MPLWAVSLLAACTVLLSFNISANNPVLLKASYVGALFVMPEGAFFTLKETLKDFRESLFGKDSIIFQKSGTLNDFINSSDLTQTPSDILNSMNKKNDENYGYDGEIIEKTFTDQQATDSYDNVFVRNVTDSTEIDISAVLSDDFSLPVSNVSEPVVLIYHTHTTETYILGNSNSFSSDTSERSDDSALNMLRIGDEIAGILESNSIGVIHDRTVYDSVYTGAYGKSREGIQKILNDNPSIIITLDIHRDAIHYSDTQRVKPCAEINGENAAQMMIVAGCQDGNVTDFPDWETNLSFALHLQKTANDKYENLMKPVFFCMRKYNMDLTPYSLLIEVGTDVNTLQEAAYSGRLLGDVLSDFIKDYAKD